MRPGVDAGSVDRACRGRVLDAGIRGGYTNRIGYSLGLVYPPSGGEYYCEFVSGADWILQRGMVFHMLVMGGGMGFSETVLVGEHGAELLTQFERSLYRA